MSWRIASLLALILAAGAGCAVRADAQPPYSRGPVYGSSSWQQIAYDDGYRAGLISGERDARSGRPYDYRHERVYRDRDHGYRYGNRGQYRQIFRRAFEVGYRDGYGRFSRYGQRGPNWRYPDREYGYGYDYGSRAWDKGFADGYEKGREDARDNDRFDPRRHKWYREGDRGYDRRDGSRDRYESEYRNAFLQGYQQGYGEHGRYRRY